MIILKELYKNEQTRRNQISKIDDDGGGFKPKAFKSSRSTQKTAPKLSKEQEHDNAIFGPVTSKSEASLPSQPVQVNVVSSHVKSLMHESVRYLDNESFSFYHFKVFFNISYSKI